ncbi:MAG: ATP-binding protein, partial [Anaerolineae bacterium]|nr:ATP-binding protein [Anaerolineae bacterium]
KFNTSGGEVHITARNDGNAILMSVRDSGIGIPFELQSKIFDRFFRGHQQGAEHISGSGLGLSLVKAVVDNHAGQIWLESIPGSGTTFSIRVPAVDRPALVNKETTMNNAKG